MEHLISTSNLQEWRSTVSVECTETIPGSWAEKVEISKAMRCYAVETGARLVDVSEDDVRNSELGVAGYAALFEKTPAALPKAGGDGSAAKGGKKRNTPEESGVVGGPGGEEPPAEEAGNNKSKKTRSSGGNLAGKKEKEVKELLAQEQSSDNTMSTITIQMGKGDATSWAWASGFVKNYYADNPFFQAMKVAVLSAKELQKVKDYKDQYLPKLCDFVSILGPKILAMAEASSQISLMSAAKANASLAGQPAKSAKAKGQSKIKRAASAASIASA